MKKLLLLLVSLSLSGCFSDDSKYALNTQTISMASGKILNKEVEHHRYSDSYRLYVYDGIDANWFDCTEEVYNSVKTTDTLKLMVLTKTYFKSNCNVKK